MVVTFEPVPLAGAYLVHLDSIGDRRGSFTRVFDVDAFGDAGLETEFPQHAVAVNSAPHVVRGLHFQAEPFGETKLIRCSVGEIFDVIVDIREDSPTFAQWYGRRLSAGEAVMLYVPHGFAHGYQSLSAEAEVHYLFSARYVPDASRGIRWNDPTLNIAWPFPAAIVSDRDGTLPLLSDLRAQR